MGIPLGNLENHGNIGKFIEQVLGNCGLGRKPKGKPWENRRKMEVLLGKSPINTKKRITEI